MFLALTAIEKYWDKSKEILFLGEWCITSKSNLSNAKYKVLDYHWKDFKKIESDNDYIFKVYKSLMPLLAEKLNKIHNIKLPFRYWEILVGVWLLKFIELSFDRYSTIIQLRKISDKIDCWVTDEYLIPPTFGDFYLFSQEDKYNFSFFSSIINKLKLNINLTRIDFDPDNIPSSVTNNINDYEANKRIKPSKNIIQKIKRIKIETVVNKIKNINFIRSLIILPYKIIIYKFRRFLSFFYNDIFLNINLAIYENDLKKTFRRLKHVYYKNPTEMPGYAPKKIKPDQNLRKDKIIYPNVNEFIKLLCSLILENIPMEYLEHFSGYRQYCINSGIIPKKIPHIVAIRSSFEYQAQLRFLASEFSNLGSNILTIQEGGGMNVRKINQKDVESNYIGCDYFLSWGWKYNHDNFFRFHMSKTFWIKKNTYNKNGHILMVGGSCRRYHWSVYEGHIINSFYKKHVNLNNKFLKLVNKEVYDKILYRFHIQFGQNEIKDIMDENPKLTISLREDDDHFYELLYNSSITVMTSDYTANLQSMIINRPTLWLWDSDYHTIREDSKKYYDELHDVGILYYDPLSCAKKINEISIDPMKWWMSEDIQKARSNFSNNFCNVSEDLSYDLYKIVNKIIGKKNYAR